MADRHPVVGAPLLDGGPVAFALARLLALLGEREEALQRLNDAAASRVALGARPAQARVAFEHGTLLARMRRVQEARARLTEALRAAADLGQSGLRRRAENALAELG